MRMQAHQRQNDATGGSVKMPKDHIWFIGLEWRRVIWIFGVNNSLSSQIWISLSLYHGGYHYPEQEMTRLYVSPSF